MPQNEEHQKALQHLSNMSVYDREQRIMNDVVSTAAKQILSGVENDKVKLVVHNIEAVHRHDNGDKSAQQYVRNSNGTWSDELKADVTLHDKETGMAVDHATIKIADIPKLTDRNTYIIGGNEYGFTTQARLKPGVYTKAQNNGEVSSFFNVDKTIDFDRGFNNNFKITFDPAQKSFWLQYGQKNVPLITALRALGQTDTEIKHSLGEEVYQANSHRYDKAFGRDLLKFHQAVFGKLPESSLSQDQVGKAIRDRLYATKLDPETTKLTLGKPYENVNGNAITDAVKKIIGIHKGTVEPDDREALIFKSFVGPEDIVRESLVKSAKKVQSNLAYKLDRTREIRKSMSSSTLSPYVAGTLVVSKLSNPPSQVNVMSILGDGSKVTIMGEGGVGSANAISDEARAISNTEVGFIDPLHTPEGGGIGIVNHFSNNTIRVGKDIYAKFMKPDGKLTMARPLDVFSKVLAFPDEYKDGKPIGATVKATKGGKLVEVKPSEVDLIIPNSRDMFDYSANAIPFLNSIQGNRGLTASKMQEQALPLKHREEPLFSIVDEHGRDLHARYGQAVGVPHAPASGKIMSVDGDYVKILDKDKVLHKVGLYNNFSMNNESFLHNTSKVKPGDEVKQGQVIAESNNTVNGRLAAGVNLRVAYMPYRGYNYEDSTIISESAAKKLTSEHIYDFKAQRSSGGMFSRAKFRAHYPEELSKKNHEKLDEDGVIKVGESVEHGDVLIAHLEKTQASADDIAMGRLDKQLRRPMTSHAVKWEAGHHGIVTSIEKKGRDVVVNIKTEEPLVVGDKISGLHGNKHIVSSIVADSEMPIHSKTGEHIEMTMSPIGVTNRINTSQLLENAAGKLAKATGKQYVINQFGDYDNTSRLMADMKAAGVSHSEMLIDPKTGKEFINPIANGYSHILKLEHKVDHKFSARYREGHDSNQQAVTGGETGGKNLGRMEIAALLARGAHANLNEMFNIKGQRNDDFWRAIETGQTPPPPKDSFVWGKMQAMMKGAGVNVEKNGKSLGLSPLTDHDITQLSHGHLDNAVDTYRKKDLSPIRGGLFDPVKAGGMMGEHYTHFNLPEEILNPAMEDAASGVLGMTGVELQSVIHGKKFVNKIGELVAPGTTGAISGGPGLRRLLETVNVDKHYGELAKQAETTKDATKLNKINRQMHYLRNMQEKGTQPTDYLISKVLVIPSKYRPMFSMGADNTVIMSDVNYLYQQAAQTGKAFKELHDQIHEASGGHEDLKNSSLAQIRGAMYDDVKAVTGFGDPTSFLNKQKGRKGFMSLIDGGDKQTKEGFFQSKVMERRQDLVGRSTIILNPELGPDELGIPKQMASKIFQPMIMAKLISWGYKPLEAKKQVEDCTPVFEKARTQVASDRLVIANRAPSLHRWNMTAMKPVLIEGKHLEVPSIVISKNFGGDFDGDCIQGSSKIALSSRFFDVFRETFNSKDKCVFGGLYIDTDDCDTYINSIIKPMEINMPAIDKVTVIDVESVLHINLEDFPRIESSKVVHENGNEEYDVPEGVSIFTLDNSTHEFVKVPVTKYSVHKNLASFHVELSDGSTLWLSEDESAIAIKTSDWSLERISPKNSSGRMMAKVLKVDVEESTKTWSFDNSSAKGTSILANKSFNLDENSGWFFGSIIGDGWASVSNSKSSLCMSSIHDSIGLEFSRIADSMLTQPIACTVTESNHVFDGFDCYSKKYTKSSSVLSRNIANLIGEGAINKRLPSFYASAPREFKVGMLAGLLDTDGTVQYVSKASGKRQFNLMYTTISERLACDVMELCRMIGVKSSIGTYQRKTCVEYRVIISTLSAHGLELKFRHPDKNAAWSEFTAEGVDKKSTVAIRQDLVPFSTQLSMLCAELVHYKKNASEYNAIHDAKKSSNVYISRDAAKRIIALDTNHSLPARWIELVNNNDVTWLYVKGVDANKKLVDMYDITAPGPYTFMVANGIIVQDTFQIHTPIGAKAIAEAHKMLPSSSTLKTGYDSVLNAPDQDILAGAWLATKGMGGKDKSDLKFGTEHEIEDALRLGKIDDSDHITFHGKKATAAHHIINSQLPEEARDYGIVLDKKNMNEWLKNVAIKHGDKMSVDLADHIKTVGNRYVTRYGLSLGIEDTQVHSDAKHSVLNGMKGAVYHSANDLSSAYSAAKTKISDIIKSKLGTTSNLGIGVSSGGSKGMDNIMAITGMPGIVMDANNRPIPMPITYSYSEGLSGFDYWAAAHGARTGNIQKSVSSFKPGWLTKDLINSIYATKIDGDKHIDTGGIEYAVSDKKAVKNRFTSKDIKDKKGNIVVAADTRLDDTSLNALHKAGVSHVFVQSPLTDPTPGDGFSSRSYGTDHHGATHLHGADIGIMSAHTITEPSLNMAMKSFHTGGVYTGKKTETAFDILDKTMRFAQIPDHAAMSGIDGKIESAHKSSVGGHNIVIRGKNGETEELYNHPGNAMKFHVGAEVKKGDALDNGPVSMHDVLRTQGMRATQKFLVHAIDSVDPGALDRRDIETLVRGITNTTRVLKDPSGTYIPGDTAPLSTVEHMNTGGAKINHEPFLMPLGIGNKASISKDWLARMAHTRIRKVMSEGAAQGWKSDTSGANHPIPMLVAGGYNKEMK